MTIDIEVIIGTVITILNVRDRCQPEHTVMATYRKWLCLIHASSSPVTNVSKYLHRPSMELRPGWKMIGYENATRSVTNIRAIVVKSVATRNIEQSILVFVGE